MNDKDGALPEASTVPASIPDAEKRVIKTAGELRGFLADVLIGIQNGDINADKAHAIAKVSAQINQSLAVEVNTVLQLQRIGKGHAQPEAGDLLIASDVWCDQCDKRVSAAQAAGCTSKFCKAKA